MKSSRASKASILMNPLRAPAVVSPPGLRKMNPGAKSARGKSPDVPNIHEATRVMTTVGADSSMGEYLRTSLQFLYDSRGRPLDCSPCNTLMIRYLEYTECYEI